MLETSPAVERAQADVETLAKNRGDTTPTLADWFLILLSDEDGKPARLFELLNINLQAALKISQEQVTHHRDAPPTYRIVSRARDLAVLLKADPTLTTDAILLAVIEAAETVDGGFHTLGAALQRLADAYSGNLTQQEEFIEENKEFVVSQSNKQQQQTGRTFLSRQSAAFEISEERDTDQVCRILDAALNRARESVRVVDDYARFGLNDGVLTEELKKLRHALVEATTFLPPHLMAQSMLQYRDTLGDVGTTITTASEYHRTSPRDTAQVNFKRLQESLRSIEEYGKQLSAEFGRKIESLRYRVYTLEKSFFLGSSLKERIAATHLYVLLTGQQCVAALDWTIKEAAAGGVGVFQLREKELADRELLDRAKKIRQWTRETNTLMIVNDRVDIAKLSDADGVHLGQEDMSVGEARRILGQEKLIGVSTHDTTQIHQAVLDGADYLGVGPVFPSQTKSFEHFPGLEFVSQAAHMTRLPMFALGGISTKNVAMVVQAGINRVAVASAITTTDEPQLIAKIFSEQLQK